MLTVFDHPLIKHKLTIMRKKETGTKDFRQNLDEIGGLMVYEVTRDLPLNEIPIDSKSGSWRCKRNTKFDSYCKNCSYWNVS